LLLVQGCSDKDDPPQTTRVVSKRINIAKKQVSQQEHPVKKKIASKAETASSGFAGHKVGQKSDLLPVAALKKGIQKENQSRPLALANIYNPKGKNDPFVPLFQEKPAETPVETKKRKKRIPRTPLEMIALNQLKLTAIILRPAGNKALLEEATGRGYVVIKGTPVGKNWGKITEILKDRIIVEEEVENLLGKVALKRNEIKIQRPPGEL
jgi:type IV pilus assembly protein PilP